MSDITKSSSAKPEGNAELTLTPISAKVGYDASAGAGDAVYLDSNGILQKALRPTVFVSGTYGVVVKFAGLLARNTPSGQVGEVYGQSSEWFYADSGLVIGSAVFPSATGGKLADAAVNAADQPVAMVVSATNIRLIAGI